MTTFTALVLAGRRGSADPLSGVRGASHRALVEVCGVPMLVRVVRTLRAAHRAGRILVSIDDPAAVRAVPELSALESEGQLALLGASRESPSRSVLGALEGLGAGEKLLVTTADHPLLTPEMVDHFADASERTGADLAVGMVAASLLRAHFPESTRTYLWLRDDGYSGANLFAFRSAEARRAAAFWERAERFRKRPLRMVGVFGPVTLALFALRRLDLEAALDRISRAIGARVAAVRMPFPEAAIDVDRPSDLALATRILAQRTHSPSGEKRPVTGS